jgi:hypothetical protein
MMNKTQLPKMGTKEYRAFGMPDLTVQPEGNVLQGHAAVFDQTTDIGGMFNEIIDRGAFSQTDFTDVLMSINHDLDRIPLARSRNNNANSTLQLQVDNTGLAIRANLDVDNNQEAKALYSSIQRGDINGMSFIFYVRGENWEGLDTETPTRHITDIAKVIEVSAVSFPAYDQTDISARSSEALDSAKKTLDSAKAEYIEKQNANTLEQKRKALILKTLY